jgi:predicted hydrocarbon binding protein
LILLNIERKTFLKNACSYGICGCVGLSFLTGTAVTGSKGSSKDGKEPDWQIDFMQDRFRDLITILNNDLDEETLIPILKQLGAKCGNYFAEKYKNDPGGFFAFIKDSWVDTVDYNKEEGIISVNERVRETCNCPMVKEKNAPAVLCNCSLGTQKRIYESLFDKPVDVTLNKSVPKGDERCSFTIRLL